MGSHAIPAVSQIGRPEQDSSPFRESGPLKLQLAGPGSTPSVAAKRKCRQRCKQVKVRVGIEATGHARWFERLLAELKFESGTALPGL